LITLGVVLTAAQGYSAPEVGAVFAQARQLCTGLGRSASLFPVLHGLYRFYYVRSEITTAVALSEEMLASARESDDADLLMEAHRAVGNCRFMLGDFAEAMTHLELSSSLYIPRLSAAHRLTYGIDPLVGATTQQAVVAALLGDIERAGALSEDAIVA